MIVAFSRVTGEASVGFSVVSKQLGTDDVIEVHEPMSPYVRKKETIKGN